jgi:hypothetical protein
VNQKAAQSPDAAGVVLTFLESVGRRSEAELYLKMFRELPKESFAIIAAESAVLRYAAGSLVEQLRFLRELGLFAPVAVGLFEPRAAEKAAARLVKRSADMGAVIEDAEDPHLAHNVLEELAGELGTRKIVVLRRRGGFRRHGRAAGVANGDAERRISVINLRTDTAALSEPRALLADDAELLGHLRELLERPECARAVASVTSPLNLLRELFTVKGAGTLVKRGTAIERHESYASVDVPRLVALLESSFGRKLQPEFFERAPLAVYLEENYRAAAIIVAAPLAPYLTKFAVDRVAQGEGMGRDLWEAIARDHKALFWRGRMENPIASWYTSLCDGMMKVRGWTVYFRGISEADVPSIVRDAVDRPEDFGSPITLDASGPPKP